MAADHFSDEDWLDFVRQVASDQNTARIQQHLDEGCAECRNVSGIWHTAGLVIRRSEQHQCPDTTVRSSEVSYAEWRWRYLILPRARVARLVFDSFLEPAATGARANAAPTRRVLQRIGPWAIDFRLEPERGSRVSLVGQVLRSGKKYAGSGGIEIVLMSSDTFMAKTTANEFGEFQLQFEWARNLRMYFEIPEHEPIAVDVPDLAEGGAPPEAGAGPG